MRLSPDKAGIFYMSKYLANSMSLSLGSNSTDLPRQKRGSDAADSNASSPSDSESYSSDSASSSFCSTCDTDSTTAYSESESEDEPVPRYRPGRQQDNWKHRKSAPTATKPRTKSYHSGTESVPRRRSQTSSQSGPAASKVILKEVQQGTPVASRKDVPSTIQSDSGRSTTAKAAEKVVKARQRMQEDSSYAKEEPTKASQDLPEPIALPNTDHERKKGKRDRKAKGSGNLQQKKEDMEAAQQQLEATMKFPPTQKGNDVWLNVTTTEDSTSVTIRIPGR